MYTFIEIPLDRFEMACQGFTCTGQYFTFLSWADMFGGGWSAPPFFYRLIEAVYSL